ncbi:MAG: hypothetical protein ACK5NX_03065, partial [Armatimonadota bacterium]
MNRITKVDMEGVRARIARTMGLPDGPLWTTTPEGRNVATVGALYWSRAYGGWCLYQMTNEAGGVRNLLSYGHAPARKAYDEAIAFARGLEAARTVEEPHMASKRITVRVLTGLAFTGGLAGTAAGQAKP